MRRSASRAGHSLALGKDPVPIVQEAGWAPGPVWTGVSDLPLCILFCPSPWGTSVPWCYYTARNTAASMNLYRQEYQIGGRRASPPQIVLFAQDLRGSPHTHFRTSMYLMVVEHDILWCLDRVQNVCSKEIFYHYSSTCTLPLCTLLSLGWAVIPGRVTFSCPVSVIFDNMCVYFETRLRPGDGRL